jgi:hypothetical protein
MARVYLDTSIYNRPFDDQTQAKIFLETQAVVIILKMVESELIELVSSGVLEFDILPSAIPWDSKPHDLVFLIQPYISRHKLNLCPRHWYVHRPSTHCRVPIPQALRYGLCPNRNSVLRLPGMCLSVALSAYPSLPTFLRRRGIHEL